MHYSTTLNSRFPTSFTNQDCINRHLSTYPSGKPTHVHDSFTSVNRSQSVEIDQAKPVSSNPKDTFKKTLDLLNNKKLQLKSSNVHDIDQTQCIFNYGESLKKFGGAVFGSIGRQAALYLTLFSSTAVMNIFLGIHIGLTIALSVLAAICLFFSMVAIYAEIKEAQRKFCEDLEQTGLYDKASQINQYIQDSKQTRQDLVVIKRALKSLEKIQDTKQSPRWMKWHEKNIEKGLEVSQKITAKPSNTGTTSPSKPRPKSAHNPFYWMFLHVLISRA